MLCSGSIGQAEAPPLSVFGNLPGFEQAAISPSGQHVAIVGKVLDKRALLVVDDQNNVIDVLGVDQIKISNVGWAGDGNVLLTTHNTAALGIGFTADKVELSGVIVKPVEKGAKPWRVFEGSRLTTGGVFDNLGVASRDGHLYGYFSTLTMNQKELFNLPTLPIGQQHPDLYEVDLASRDSRKIANRPDGDGISRYWLVDSQGTVAARLDYLHNNGEWDLYNAARKRIADGTQLDTPVRILGFTADGMSVVYRLQDQWFSVPLAGGDSVPFLPGISVNRLVIDNQHRIIGYIDDTKDNEGHFFDPHKQAVYRATRNAFKGSRVTYVGANDAFDRLIVITEGPGDPITWWLVDATKGHAEPLGTSYQLAPGQVGPVQMIGYTAGDGLKMEGVLTLPPGLSAARPTKGLPAVVLPHGGPASRDTAGFDWLAQAFASRGYAVFQPNFRGSTGYGTDFEAASKGEWGRKMQSDISDGLAELVHQGLVDPNRVCIAGASYGGYAALAGVTLQQGIYRCAVSIAGIGDLNQMVNADNSKYGNDPLIARGLRAELGSGRDLAAVSPIRFVDRVTVPVLLIHGQDDTVVAFQQSKRMADALRKAGKTVSLVTLPGGDHWLSTAEGRMGALKAAMEFVVSNNPPDAPAAKQ